MSPGGGLDSRLVPTGGEKLPLVGWLAGQRPSFPSTPSAASPGGLLGHLLSARICLHPPLCPSTSKSPASVAAQEEPGAGDREPRTLMAGGRCSCPELTLHWHGPESLPDRYPARVTRLSPRRAPGLPSPQQHYTGGQEGLPLPSKPAPHIVNNKSLLLAPWPAISLPSVFTLRGEGAHAG